MKTAKSEYLRPVTKIAVICPETIAELNEKDYALFGAENVSIETSNLLIFNC